MRFETEYRIFYKRKETLLDKYIDSLLTDDIKNLTIKEEWIMLEELKTQREEYIAEVDRLNNVNLEEIVNARFELIKDKIAEEVKAEHEEKLAKANLNVEHYNFVIERMEAKALKELTVNESDVTDIEEVDEVPNGAEVYDVVNIVEG